MDVCSSTSVWTIILQSLFLPQLLQTDLFCFGVQKVWFNVSHFPRVPSLVDSGKSLQNDLTFCECWQRWKNKCQRFIYGTYVWFPMIAVK